MKNSIGYGPLTYAAALNQHDCVNYLSLRMRNIDEEGAKGGPMGGLTVFSKYLLLNKFEMAQKLISRNTNINYRNREGRTPIVLAILSNNE
jgi:ankyrin repeat protein